MPVTISGRTLDIAPGGSPNGLYVSAGSLQMQNAVGQRSTADFLVIDRAGSQHYEQDMPLVITDNATGALLFGGFIDGAQERQTTQGALLEHTITCKDNHFLADKRRFPYSSTGKAAGQIVADMLSQALASEGVWAVKNLLSANQSDVETDLTGFTAMGGAGTTMTRDTSTAQHGTASLKVVTDGTGTFQGAKVTLPFSSLAPGGVYTFSVYAKGSGTVNLVVQQDVSPFSTYGFTTITLTGAWTRYQVKATLPSSLPAGNVACQIATGSTPAAVSYNADQFQVELSASATAWELGGTSSVQTGSVINEFTSNYETCAACLDALAQSASFIWQIDATKRLWFGSQGQQLAPWSPTAADMERDTIAVEHTNPLYRNRQYVLGGKATTNTQTETRKGDGNTTAFAVSYPLASVPTITVNGVAKTLGIKGVDTGKDWYWSKGDPVLAQDSSGTKLVSTDTWQIQYQGLYPVVIQSDDTGQQTLVQSRDGNSTTGIIEDVAQDATLNTTAGAFQLATGYLSRYAQLGKILTFQTLRAGLAQGQLATCTVPGHSITGEQMLIESVQAAHDGIRFWYTVKAIEGPVNTTWVQFFTALASKAAVVVDKINLGANGTLVLAASFSATWTWAASLNAVTTALSYPSATNYPGATNYPA